MLHNIRLSDGSAGIFLFMFIRLSLSLILDQHSRNANWSNYFSSNTTSNFRRLWKKFEKFWKKKSKINFYEKFPGSSKIPNFWGELFIGKKLPRFSHFEFNSRIFNSILNGINPVRSLMIRNHFELLNPFESLNES